MAQQTAVEWLFKEISAILGPIKTDAMQDMLLVDAIQQANKMFEKQIIAACNQTDVIGLDHEQPGQQYYNETYGK